MHPSRTFSHITKIVAEFPMYEISEFGVVFNSRTGRELTWSPVTGGDMSVGLYDNKGKQHRRSVKRLVAEAFVDGEDEICNTPIVLDGNERNLHYTNVVWRPRWLAWDYKRQFENPLDNYYVGPIVDLTTGMEYRTILDAAKATGNLAKYILMGILNHTHVPITNELYDWAENAPDRSH